jgi:4-amino-4-deoxy-L-arabinose transferase-like glycosyltransferase
MGWRESASFVRFWDQPFPELEQSSVVAGCRFCHYVDRSLRVEPVDVPTEPATSNQHRATFAVLLALVTALAAVVRLYGIGFGLPFLYHPDEGEIVNRALAMLTGGPNPHWFVYPSLCLYVHAVAYALLYVGMLLSGLVASRARFVESTLADPTTVYLVGRTVSVLFGTASVMAVGIAGRGVRGLGEAVRDRVGLCAAGLLALAPLHVEHSRYATTDVPLAFFATLLLAVAARSRPTVTWYAALGAIVGLAASTKYPGAFLALFVFLLHEFTRVHTNRSEQPFVWIRVDSWKPLLVAGLAAVGGFLLGTPFALVSPGTLVEHVRLEGSHMREGHLGFEASGNGWLAQLGNLYDSGGAILVALFVVGAIAAIRRRDPLVRAAAVTAVGLFAIAGSSRALFGRYLLPLLPFVCLVAAYGIVWTGECVARHSRAVVAVLLAATLALPAFIVFHDLRLLGASDTRTLAWEWLRSTVGNPAEVAAERYSIPADATALEYDAEALRARGVLYVAVTDRMYRRYLIAPDRYPKQVALYRELLDRGTLVAAFTPYDGDAGRLVRGADGSPSIVRGADGPDWEALAKRRLSGPVILVYQLSWPVARDP